MNYEACRALVLLAISGHNAREDRTVREGERLVELARQVGVLVVCERDDVSRLKLGRGKARKARRKNRKPQQMSHSSKPGNMPLADAMAMAEDLPDGAYFAMIEELSGCDASAVADYCKEHDDDES